LKHVRTYPDSGWHRRQGLVRHFSTYMYLQYLVIYRRTMTASSVTVARIKKLASDDYLSNIVFCCIPRALYGQKHMIRRWPFLSWPPSASYCTTPNKQKA
jgi:hypothetical protein